MWPGFQGTTLNLKSSAPAAPVMVSAPWAPTSVSLPAPPCRLEPPSWAVSTWPPLAGGGGETGGGGTGGGETGGGEAGGGGEAAPKPTRSLVCTVAGATWSRVVTKVPHWSA